MPKTYLFAKQIGRILLANHFPAFQDKTRLGKYLLPAYLFLLVMNPRLPIFNSDELPACQYKER